jgi:hypothetical protein
MLVIVVRSQQFLSIHKHTCYQRNWQQFSAYNLSSWMKGEQPTTRTAVKTSTKKIVFSFGISICLILQRYASIHYSTQRRMVASPCDQLATM